MFDQTCCSGQEVEVGEWCSRAHDKSGTFNMDGIVFPEFSKISRRGVVTQNMTKGAIRHGISGCRLRTGRGEEKQVATKVLRARLAAKNLQLAVPRECAFFSAKLFAAAENCGRGRADAATDCLWSAPH